MTTFPQTLRKPVGKRLNAYRRERTCRTGAGKISDHETGNWSRIQQLFEAALELPESERDRFVKQQRLEKPHVVAEVTSLLACFKSGKQELERPPAAVCDIHLERRQIAADAVRGYEILGEIQRGGQGVVYRAIQLGTKREVALKFMLTGPFASEATRRRFEREVELVSQLTHPGIVPVFDSGVAHGQQFYVMEYVPGLMLHDYVTRNNLNVDQILRLFVRICDAVNFAHDKGVIHRDLKPSNIIVSSDEHPHVLDFGLAKLGNSSDADTIPLSMTGQLMGTLAYMSPEHASGQPNQVDTTSDVYALAVILYELLAKRLPYDLDQSMVENLATIQNIEAMPLKTPDSRIDSDVVRIVHKSLSKNKDRRYPHAGALRDDVERFLRGEAVEAKRDSTFYVLRKRAKRYAVQSCIAVALLCGVWIGFAASRGGGPPPEIAAPLQLLTPGRQHSQLDFENQLDAMRDFIRRGDGLPELFEQLHLRFDPIQRSDFDPAMSDQREADLQKMKSLDKFLVGNPSKAEINRYLVQETRIENLVDGPARTSGLANEIAAEFLRLALLAAART